MTDFRNSRIGVRNASLILGVTVTELREAILGDGLVHGVEPPQPWYSAGHRKSEMMFRASDVMDCAETIKKTTS